MPNTAEAEVPSDVVARRVRALRNSRGWTQAELARRMQTYGYKWDRTTIAKVEGGSRQLNIDDVLTLAYTLGVSPAALVTPNATSAAVAVTPNTDEPASNVWRWMIGTTPMGGTPKDDVISVDEALANHRFNDEACPDYITTAENELPGLRRLIHLLTGVQSLAGRPDVEGARDHEVDHLEEATELLRSIKHRSQMHAKRKAQS